MRQHHALRIGGGARGVEDHGGRAAVRIRHGLCGRIGDRRQLTASVGACTSSRGPLRQFGQRLGGRGRQALAGEQHAGAGVTAGSWPPAPPNSWCRTARRWRRGRGWRGRPRTSGVVVGENRAAIAGLNAGRRQPRRSIQHEGVQIAIGETIETVFTLDLHRHPIAHTADGVLEDAEQGRHATVTHYHFQPWPGSGGWLGTTGLGAALG